MDILYIFLTLSPGISVTLLMVLSYFKYKNIFLGLFTMSYISTGLMSFVMFLRYNVFRNSNIFLYDYLELFCMIAIVFGSTWLVIKLFYIQVRSIWKIGIIMIGSIPVCYYSIGVLFFKTNIINNYNICYLIFFSILTLDCLIFGLNYRKILQEKHRKFGVLFWALLLIFLVIFFAQRITQIQLNPLFLFYFLWTLLLLWYIWKNVISVGIDKFFFVQESFTKEYNLTKRESEIIDLIMEGHTNGAIGEKLFISEKTVTNHVYNIYKKLDIHSRFELICLMKK